MSFDQDQNEYRMRYAWQDAGDHQVRLVYEEEIRSKGMMNTLNRKLSSLLFGRTARKQIRGRLDAFAKGLEEFTCPD